MWLVQYGVEAKNTFKYDYFILKAFINKQYSFLKQCTNWSTMFVPVTKIFGTHEFSALHLNPQTITYFTLKAHM